MRGPQRSYADDYEQRLHPVLRKRPRAAIGHMPFAGHRTCAEWGVTPPAPEPRLFVRPRHRPMNFDEQMEAVRNGASLIEQRPIRRSDPIITLGGVSRPNE